MKNLLLAAAATAALITVPTVANAQDADQGWYVRGNLGAGAFSDMDLSDGMVGDIEAEANGAGSLGLGYELGNNWRVELDGSSMWNDMGQIGQAPASYAKFRGTSAMLNAIYDFNDFGRWEPYVGAGIGIMRGKLDAEAHDFVNASSPLIPITNPACTNLCTVNDSTTSTAWNLLAGLGYDISEHLSWDTHYRYLNAGDMSFDGVRNTFVPFTNTIASTSGINVDADDIGAHQLMTGFRYRFGGAKAMPVKTMPVAPPPPPPPAQVTCWDGSLRDTFAQCPVETPSVVETPTIVCFDGTVVFDQASCPTPPPPPPPPVVVQQEVSICDQGDVPFVVYFEWDKSRLTEQASAVIDQASVYTQQCGVSGVTVEGYTDTSGSAAYNVALSNRRADVVANALSTRGVDAGAISRSGLGEQGLAVQTEDGVREPLNRRSEVVIRLVPSYGVGNSF